MVFSSKIKDVTVNSIHNCYGKYANAVPLKPCWRLNISVNDEEEILAMVYHLLCLNKRQDYAV